MRNQKAPYVSYRQTYFRYYNFTNKWYSARNSYESYGTSGYDVDLWKDSAG